MQKRKRHTRKNWTHFANVWNGDQDMVEKRIDKKNQDKNIRDDDAADCPVGIGTMRKQDEKMIPTAEMSRLWGIAGVTRLQKIRSDVIRQVLGS